MDVMQPTQPNYGEDSDGSFLYNLRKVPKNQDWMDNITLGEYEKYLIK